VISATTRVAAVIGSPVRHSLSPALHNAGFAATGADWVYMAFDVAPGSVGDALDAMRTLGLGGLSVTMPHKEAVAELVDELDPAAAALCSVNTVVPIGNGHLMGYSTDGAGFVASLGAQAIDVGGQRVCVVGAGGAARAIVDAVTRAGASAVVVVNRSVDRALIAAQLAGAAGSIGDVAAIAEADIVVNATSVGMGSDDLPFDPALLHAGQVVADIVYHPRRTTLLAAAAERGARTVEGLGMLVHQAVLQQQLWTGLSPDPAVMWAAAERELAARGQ
jgi:shikimate dehydrogenase